MNADNSLVAGFIKRDSSKARETIAKKHRTRERLWKTVFERWKEAKEVEQNPTINAKGNY